MRAVAFAGESLAGFAEPASTVHIKLSLPDAHGNRAGEPGATSSTRSAGPASATTRTSGSPARPRWSARPGRTSLTSGGAARR
ncbi:hypothetical protein [Streptomyces sp. NPDC056405]|uniref:hypothetical protein n=1 Tax=Streptomyces sp. NPDC056405 TaxID=3345811 RepID=UPI0035D77790